VDPEVAGSSPVFHPKPLQRGVFCYLSLHFGIAFANKNETKPTAMFTLFQSSPKFPVVKPVNIRQIKNYLSKFEEAIKTCEELQKEAVHS
jgi:hypothetical protein